MYPDRPSSSDVVPAGLAPGPDPDVIWVLPPRPPRFQHRYGKHVVLFVLTLLTMTMSGACHYLGFESSSANTTPAPVESFTELVALMTQWSTIAGGLTYAIPLLVILGAHEFGHYAYCRRHQVDATLPYFIPAPIPLTGTLGAVIRIREAFPSKKALFDIGVAGPIAGFVALIPFLIWGMQLSVAIPVPESADLFYFGEPLLLKAVAYLKFGTLPEGVDIFLHPMGFAAWFGILATALNLLPFGQLDGGHIAYAVLGRRAAWISGATLLAAVILTAISSSWFAMALMLLVMAFFLGIRHPRIIDEDTPLDSGRVAVAAFALVMFIVCFTPVPIEFFPAGGP